MAASEILTDLTTSSAPPPPARHSRHIPALDGVRGLAILGVMFYHFNVQLSFNNLFDRSFHSLTEFGSYGVNLFFVLSGFLITGILCDSKASPRFFTNFYARRTVRIFPLYYAFLAFVLLILPRVPMAAVAVLHRPEFHGGEFWYWLYLSNFAQTFHWGANNPFLGISWSLVIEEQFYLCRPLVVYLTTSRQLFRICIGLICFSPIFRMALGLAHVDPVTIHIQTLSMVDALAMGAVVGILYRDGGLTRFVPGAKVAAAALAIFFLIYILVPTPLSKPGCKVMMLGVTASLLAILSGCLIVISAAAPGAILNRFFLNRTMRLFGKYSYAMYMFNALVRDAVKHTIV